MSEVEIIGGWEVVGPQKLELKNGAIQHVAVLPCDIHTQVFVPCMNGEIMTKRVQSFKVTKYKISILTEYDTPYEIGTDAFLSYAEARQNLKDRGWE